MKILAEGAGELRAELVRIFAPATVEQLVRHLPLEGLAGKWEFAVYFQTQVSRGAEKPTKKMAAGEIGYWPPLNAICVFFHDASPPAQTVKVGRVLDDSAPLSQIRAGARVRILRA